MGGSKELVFVYMSLPPDLILTGFALFPFTFKGLSVLNTDDSTSSFAKVCERDTLVDCVVGVEGVPCRLASELAWFEERIGDDAFHTLFWQLINTTLSHAEFVQVRKGGDVLSKAVVAR